LNTAIPRTSQEAAARDATDPLSAFRSRFAHPDPAIIYMDGNSLGRAPVDAAAHMQTVVEKQWGDRLIRSWSEEWFTLPERIGGKIAQLVGAEADEVIVADSTSVNLYKLATAALHARPGRARILTDDGNFPSDLYILQGIAQAHGATLDVVAAPDIVHGATDALVAALDKDVALLTLSHTLYKSAYTYDMAALTEAAHGVGALTLWDLSHSAGAVPVTLNDAGADLAVGCCYKYLNGGPGAPAFLYVRRDLQAQLANPIQGWMGQRDLFDFDSAYAPVAGLRRFLSGTPPVLSMSAIEPGVDLLLEAGMDALRAKSLVLSDMLIALWEERLAPLGFRLQTPRDPARRGSHISLGHDDAWRIDQAIIHQMGVLPDFRQPDTIRLGIAPLYNSFADIYAAVTALQRVVEERLYTQYPSTRTAVT
jgi:kynureninase